MRGISPDISRCLRLSLGLQTLDINILMIIAVAGAIAIGDYTEAAAVVALFGVAEFLEARCSIKARDAIAAVMALKPETAILAQSGEEGHASLMPVDAS